ncbi:hypothetical protein NL676_030532 [Syzygium grande]|nr:hypothetical protein NL676_030532 [Syzygium grande]
MVIQITGFVSRSGHVSAIKRGGCRGSYRGAAPHGSGARERAPRSSLLTVCAGPHVSASIAPFPFPVSPPPLALLSMLPFF